MHPLISLLIIISVLALYLLPTAIAFSRKKKHRRIIAIVNILGGWIYGVPWLVALVWSLIRFKTDGAKGFKVWPVSLALILAPFVLAAIDSAIRKNSNPTEVASKETPTPTEAQAQPASTSEAKSQAQPTATAKPTATPKPSPTPKPKPTPTPFKNRSVELYDSEFSDFTKEDTISANMIIQRMTWSTNGDPNAAAAGDVQQFLKLAAESDKYQTPTIYGIVAGQAAQSYGGSIGSPKHAEYFQAWNKAIANSPEFKSRPVAVNMSYWEDEAKKAEIATAKTTIEKIKWSLSADLTIAATEDAKQFVALQGELKASLTTNVYNVILDSAARTFKASTNDIGYAEYVNTWRKIAGFGPEIKSRSVIINPKDPEFADESKADIAAAQALAKKIKWSLNPNPVVQATEDAEQFLKLAEAAKTYPNYSVSSIIWYAAQASANELPRLLEYTETWSKIVGGNEVTYMTRLIGEKPESTWFDGGIKAVGDIVIQNMHDPRSYKFDHFTVSVGKYKGIKAWKVDYYFRGKNAFGAMVLNQVNAYMLNGEVIGIENPKD